jgi:large-conductance mechanosensitive channel
VPFWTFFGATVIGKAIIKMHIQKVFVIIAFNESLVDNAVDHLENIPVIGKILQKPFKSFLENQKTKLHSGAKAAAFAKKNAIQTMFEWFVISMVCYFVLSIINSLAQSYHKRLHKHKKPNSNSKKST